MIKIDVMYPWEDIVTLRRSGALYFEILHKYDRNYRDDKNARLITDVTIKFQITGLVFTGFERAAYIFISFNDE